MQIYRHITHQRTSSKGVLSVVPANVSLGVGKPTASFRSCDVGSLSFIGVCDQKSITGFSSARPYGERKPGPSTSPVWEIGNWKFGLENKIYHE
nr:hypothetical protein Iba_chr12cCG23730 [Ipomoea batatas]GMD69594.1 hypothetical protein Iba_chr12dCG20520 [Ipomoea batatas]